MRSLTERHKLKPKESLTGRAKQMEVSTETGKCRSKTEDNLYCCPQAASVTGNKTWGYHYFNLPNIYGLAKSDFDVSEHFHESTSYVSAIGHNTIALTSPSCRHWTQEVIACISTHIPHQAFAVESLINYMPGCLYSLISALCLFANSMTLHIESYSRYFIDSNFL